MKTLIISSDNQVCKDVEFCLQVRYPDMTVSAVGSGIEGIESLEKDTPVLIVIDSQLGDISTKKAIEIIRKVSDVGIIFISEGQSELARALLLEAGADDYILLPFSPIEFLAKVAALFRLTIDEDFRPDGDCLSV